MGTGSYLFQNFQCHSLAWIGPYRETENDNQYALMVICFLTNYIFMIPATSKSTEDIIKAYHTGVYSTVRSSKYILSDHSSKFTCKQFDCFGKRTRLYQNLYIPLHPFRKFNHRMYIFLLKVSIRKLICNHQVDWDETVHIATIAYNVFPHSSSGESPFYLMFGCDPFMPSLFK